MSYETIPLMKVICLILILASFPTFANEKTLVVGIHPGLYFPDYEFREGNHLGIIPSIVEPFARSVGLKVDYKLVPRKRMDELMKNGEIHMRCMVGKEWVQEPQNFFWTKELFQEVSTFVRRKEAPPILKFEDLK